MVPVQLYTHKKKKKKQKTRLQFSQKLAQNR